METTDLQVVCLCAAWCGVCREYRAVFDAVAAAASGVGDADDAGETQRQLGVAAFRWIDIEDDAQWVDDIDVEDFPTLLIARAGQVLFFGTVMPHAATLARLVERAHAGELQSSGHAPAAGALARRLFEAGAGGG